jgi:hypothetical protein
VNVAGRETYADYTVFGSKPPCQQQTASLLSSIHLPAANSPRWHRAYANTLRCGQYSPA